MPQTYTYVNPKTPLLSGHLNYTWWSNRIVFDYTGGVPGLLTLSATLYLKKGGREAFVSTITVDSDYRRRGLARKVMTELEQILRSFKAVVITGESTPDGVPFWQAVGYDTSPHEGGFFTNIRKTFRSQTKYAVKSKQKRKSSGTTASLGGIRDNR